MQKKGRLDTYKAKLENAILIRTTTLIARRIKNRSFYKSRPTERNSHDLSH